MCFTDSIIFDFTKFAFVPIILVVGSMIDTSDSHDHAAGTVSSFPTIETSGATGNFYDSSTFSTAVTGRFSSSSIIS